MADFTLQCAGCGAQYDGSGGFRLRCDAELDGRHGPAFLRPAYRAQQLKVREDLPGIYRFIDWLPTGPCYVDPSPATLGEPYCYRSFGLARRLGLQNLFIAFSGYWPERGSRLYTRTFKEFEVQASIVYYLRAFADRGAPPFIVSSAGNTANSYNYHCHVLGLPLYLFVPENGLSNLLLPFETSPFLVAVRGDYGDAIELSDQVAGRLGLVRDGGALNPGRRAGMGTVMLNAVAHPKQGSGRLFDHYFQAVGSASGAIAAWEAAQQLRRDGRFGNTVTQIHMAQNSPFTPIPLAWNSGGGKLVGMPEAEARLRATAATASVLTNRRPPFEVAGGIHDVLRDSGGAAWEVTNERVFHGARAFRELEGVDIGPAAAVAVEALHQAVDSGRVRGDERVLLHVTGGGREIQYIEGQAIPAVPKMTAAPGEADRVVEAIGKPERISPEQIGRVLRRLEPAFQASP